MAVFAVNSQFLGNPRCLASENPRARCIPLELPVSPMLTKKKLEHDKSKPRRMKLAIWTQLFWVRVVSVIFSSTSIKRVGNPKSKHFLAFFIPILVINGDYIPMNIPIYRWCPNIISYCLYGGFLSHGGTPSSHPSHGWHSTTTQHSYTTMVTTGDPPWLKSSPQSWVNRVWVKSFGTTRYFGGPFWVFNFDPSRFISSKKKHSFFIQLIMWKLMWYSP